MPEFYVLSNIESSSLVTLRPLKGVEDDFCGGYYFVIDEHTPEPVIKAAVSLIGINFFEYADLPNNSGKDIRRVWIVCKPGAWNRFWETVATRWSLVKSPTTAFCMHEHSAGADIQRHLQKLQTEAGQPGAPKRHATQEATTEHALSNGHSKKDEPKTDVSKRHSSQETL